MKRIFLLLAALPVMASTPAAPPSGEFKAVSASLARSAFVEADFTETRTMPGLDRPLSSDGKILFSPRRGILRTLLKPIHQEIFISRGGVFERGEDGRWQPIKGGHHRQIRAFLDVFLAILSGDDAGLARAPFSITFSGTPADWRMELLPNKGKAAKALRLITVSGGDSRLKRLVVEGAGGDKTVTDFLVSRLRDELSEQEASTLFPDVEFR